MLVGCYFDSYGRTHLVCLAVKPHVKYVAFKLAGIMSTGPA